MIRSSSFETHACGHSWSIEVECCYWFESSPVDWYDSSSLRMSEKCRTRGNANVEWILICPIHLIIPQFLLTSLSPFIDSTIQHQHHHSSNPSNRLSILLVNELLIILLHIRRPNHTHPSQPILSNLPLNPLNKEISNPTYRTQFLTPTIAAVPTAYNPNNLLQPTS
jgi:hypothetical protein